MRLDRDPALACGVQKRIGAFGIDGLDVVDGMPNLDRPVGQPDLGMAGALLNSMTVMQTSIRQMMTREQELRNFLGGFNFGLAVLAHGLLFR